MSRVTIVSIKNLLDIIQSLILPTILPKFTTHRMSFYRCNSNLQQLRRPGASDVPGSRVEYPDEGFKLTWPEKERLAAEAKARW